MYLLEELFSQIKLNPIFENTSPSIREESSVDI
jgi:hypothetical protein